jgi:hypothetical protein
MKKVILLVTVLLLGFTMQAKPVDVAKAQRLGQQFIQNKSMFAKQASNQLDLAYTFRADNGMATAYVFNFNGGFVAVSADDCYRPVLAYSDCGTFDYDNAPDGLKFMLGELSDDIERCVAENVPMTSDIACQWKNLEAFGLLHPDRNTPVVDVLIETKWDQGTPYNMYVPNGWPTGCVATAMAQLMKYWEWPVTGTGEHSYQWNGQTLSANFGETTYDWANMLNVYGMGTITPENKEAVALLMSHCGISVDMMYAPDGSGAFSVDVPIAISNYFSYSDHATHIGRSGTYDDWIALLKTNLDQRIPIYYSGQSSEGGHAFICDGYDADDFFHINYGWGGSGNAFILLNGDHFEYTGSQAIIYDFVPDYVYNEMPAMVEDLSISIDNEYSRIGHLSWTNPSVSMTGQPLTSLDKVIIRRNNTVVREITGVAPGQSMTYDDEVPYYDQFEYTVSVVAGDNYGRTTSSKAVFGPYCEWTVIMTSASFQGWNGGGITVQNAAGSYIDFLTTNTSSAQLQHFQMALGNNNLFWTEPSAAISNLSFKVKDSQNEIVYQYEGPSSGLEAGLLRTLNNTCGNEVTCETPSNLRAYTDPENDRNIILTWESNSEPEFGYCIYRDGFLFNMAHETHYVDEDTHLGGHCYYVTALDSGGETANSNEYCATSGTGCEPPTDFYFNYTNSKKVQLNWTKPETEDISGYAIYRKTADEPYKRVKLVSATQTSATESTSVQNTVYQYAIVAVYQTLDCSSAYANDLFDVDKFYITVDWSNTPKDLQASFNEEETTVTLRWKPAFLATSYDVIRNGVKIGEATTAFFDDMDLDDEETYCYQVIAHGADFDEPSNEACVEKPEPPVLPCPAPVNLHRDEPFADAHIAWDAPEDRVPDSYTVVIINHLFDDAITEVSGITELFYEEPIHVDATDKSYKVKAVYEECESEFALTSQGDDFIRVTSLDVPESMFSAALYPNPTTGQLTVEMEGLKEVEVYNLVGQCLLRKDVPEGNAVIDMSDLQNGVYMVKVSAISGSIMQKVVKM